jgi:hypothetical protein
MQHGELVEPSRRSPLPGGGAGRDRRFVIYIFFKYFGREEWRGDEEIRILVVIILDRGRSRGTPVGRSSNHSN